MAPLDGLGHDWALIRLRIGKAYLLLGPIYLTSGWGFKGENGEKMHQLAQCINYYEAYHHVVGDLNAEPQDWPPTLSKEMRTQIAVPQGTAWTCNQGQMRMIDYSFSSKIIAHTVSLRPDWFCPTSPHIGLWGMLTARPQTQIGRKLIPPREFPFIRLRQHEEQKEKERIKAQRHARARDAVRQRLARFLQRLGFSPDEAHDHSRSPLSASWPTPTPT